MILPPRRAHRTGHGLVSHGKHFTSCPWGEYAFVRTAMYIPLLDRTSNIYLDKHIHRGYDLVI